MLGWWDDRDLADVVGEKEAKAIAKALEVRTCGELITHFPRAFSRRDDIITKDQIDSADPITFISTVVKTEKISTGKKRTEIILKNGVVLVFFHHKVFGVWKGAAIMVTGKVRVFNDHLSVTHPQCLVFSDSAAGPDAGPEGKPKQAFSSGAMKKLERYEGLTDFLASRSMIPIYWQKGGLESTRILGAIYESLRTMPLLPDPVSGGMTLNEALWDLHFPPFFGSNSATEMLKGKEALTLALVMALRRLDAQKDVANPLPPGAKQRQLVDGLPYQLTEDQEAALSEISAEMQRNFPMSRMLQGEVGSGKTVVALAAMLQAADNDKQAALLAPTEVLATQHARSITATLREAGVEANVVLLTGSMPVKAKREALLQIVSGQADIVVGTHALLEDTVEFCELSLVIVDEQHRFGVEQRDKLRAKTNPVAHLLVMTATPIPRTIAMTVFGDLAESKIKQLPRGRQPISSSVVQHDQRGWTDRMWHRLEEELAAGRQAYVVTPRISGAGGVIELALKLGAEIPPVAMPNSAPEDLAEVDPYARYGEDERPLPQESLFAAFEPPKREVLDDVPTEIPGARIGVLFGRMSGPDKEEVMQKFAAGEINVLISTTVIEVGVDVPNATIMIVRESERFGLSQLHQLRGRIGRGTQPSVCLFHTLAPEGHPAHARLQQVAGTTDGFAVAQIDLAHRREGNVLGTEQSGVHSQLQLLDVQNDSALIEQAKVQAARIIEQDLPMARAMVAGIDDDRYEFLSKT
ncbi:ATP-dependent DNA helicase RecG [Corynebacterium propinquum]|uniref:ATP-dependent DNA helicase RecG n=1 Tax=Corynebacterium propinquum TaxID=43769 RepID=UPI002543E020|nr:ATP-dependent DNA helicase RecG [Corynebacterium propinquum]MDK4251032.1 ATP-dependent DNA helicase RecG [Corynebacterium propinquum]